MNKVDRVKKELREKFKGMLYKTGVSDIGEVEDFLSFALDSVAQAAREEMIEEIRSHFSITIKDVSWKENNNQFRKRLFSILSELSKNPIKKEKIGGWDNC